MTQPNKLIMGKGNYIVTPTINALIFKQLQVSAQVGEEINLKEYQPNVINVFVINFQNHLEIQEFKNLLVNAYQEKVFKFKDLEFDFSDYTRKSIDCIIDQLNWIETFIPKSKII